MPCRGWHTDAVTTNSPELWSNLLPRIDVRSNKYTRGHAVIFGGYPMTGAARLAARACARIGAGLTTIFVEPHALDVYARHLESIMVRAIASEEDAERQLADERITAVLAGPGLGLSERTKTLVATALDCQRPVVLDADALTTFADNAPQLFTMLGPRCVLTPHEGEFGRLFNFPGSREERTIKAARLSGAVVLLKGAETVIADPNGRLVVNPPASAHLATAGSGDVLAGIITGFIAQGMDSFDAACAAVWVHSEIGRHLGPGMIADDMPEDIPRVRRLLESASM